MSCTEEHWEGGDSMCPSNPIASHQSLNLCQENAIVMMHLLKLGQGFYLITTCSNSTGGRWEGRRKKKKTPSFITLSSLGNLICCRSSQLGTPACELLHGTAWTRSKTCDFLSSSALGKVSGPSRVTASMWLGVKWRMATKIGRKSDWL